MKRSGFRTLVLFAALAGAVFAAHPGKPALHSPATQRSEASQTVAGRVRVLNHEREPVANATVTLPSGASAVTDANGTASFTEWPAGDELLIRVRHPDYLPFEGPDWPVNSTAEVMLEPSLQLPIRVVGPDGAPVADAACELTRNPHPPLRMPPFPGHGSSSDASIVQVEGMDWTHDDEGLLWFPADADEEDSCGSSTTEASGVALFAGLPEGRYVLRVRAKGFGTEIREVLVVSRRKVERIELLPARSLGIRVLKDDGLPLPDARVIVAYRSNLNLMTPGPLGARWELLTDRAGAAAVEGLPHDSGRIWLYAEADGHAALHLRSQDSPVVAPGSLLELQLPPAASICATVRDAEGVPQALSVRVRPIGEEGQLHESGMRFMPERAVTPTAGSGCTRVDRLPAGVPLQLTVSNAGNELARVDDVILETGEERVLEVEVPHLWPLTLRFSNHPRYATVVLTTDYERPGIDWGSPRSRYEPVKHEYQAELAESQVTFSLPAGAYAVRFVGDRSNRLLDEITVSGPRTVEIDCAR